MRNNINEWIKKFNELLVKWNKNKDLSLDELVLLSANSRKIIEYMIFKLNNNNSNLTKYIEDNLPLNLGFEWKEINGAFLHAETTYDLSYNSYFESVWKICNWISKNKKIELPENINKPKFEVSTSNFGIWYIDDKNRKYKEYRAYVTRKWEGSEFDIIEVASEKRNIEQKNKNYFYVPKNISIYIRNFYKISTNFESLKNHSEVSRYMVTEAELFSPKLINFYDYYNEIKVLKEKIMNNEKVCPFTYILSKSDDYENKYIKSLINILKGKEKIDVIKILVVLKFSIQNILIANLNRSKNPKIYEFYTKQPYKGSFTISENKMIENILKKSNPNWNIWGLKNEVFRYELKKKNIYYERKEKDFKINEQYPDNEKFHNRFEEKKVVEIEINKIKYITLNENKLLIDEMKRFIKLNEKIKINNFKNDSNSFKLLNKEQGKAYKFSIKNKISFITGDAGTGKTLVAKELIKKFAKDNEKTIFIAPTIKASRIMGNVLNEESCKTMQFVRNNPLILNKFNNIIIDEISMLEDIHWKIIFKKVFSDKNHKRVIFIGDINQLSPIESIGFSKEIEKIYPRIFSYLIENKRVQKKELRKIVEESKQGYINKKRRNLVKYIKTYKNLNEFVKKIKDINSNGKWVFISPVNYGLYGVKSLNNLISKRQNSNYDFKKGNNVVIIETHGHEQLKKILYYSRIMMISKVEEVNKVVKIFFKDIIKNKKTSEFEVDGWVWDGSNFFFKFNKKEDIDFIFSLANAVTIHSSQGSTFEKVCLIIPPNHNLKKENFYTGISRMSKDLIILINKNDVNKYCK